MSVCAVVAFRASFSLALAVSLYAQADLATVTGLVTDSGGAAVPGASIAIRNTANNAAHSAVTTNEGYFTVTQLAPGPYELTAAKPGFAAYSMRDIVLETGQTLRHDIALQVGAVNQTVSVQAEIAVLNTERGASNGDVIVSQEIQDVPLNGRDFTDLAFLVPGVVQNAQGGAGSGMAINGARADNTNFVVDGFSDRNSRGGAAQFRPNIDAMEEFKMEVGGFSAEYGKMAGGILNMTLKTGTNKYHGTLFEYFRNDVFDAKAYFDARPLPLHQNQFGGTISGPVRLPGYDGHDRTFFLLSMESFRYVDGQTRLGNVPSVLERAGDFSQSLTNTGARITVKDPYNKNAAFPGDAIPLARFSPVALNLLQYYPLPDRINPRNDFQAAANSLSNWDSFISKADHKFSLGDTLSIEYGKRFGRSNAPFAGSNLARFPNWIQDDRSLAGVTYTKLFTPTVIMEARIGFSRNSSREHMIGSGADTAAQIGISGSTGDPVLRGMPLINVTSFLAIGYAANEPVQYFVTDYQAGDKLTWVRGKHVLKFGIDLSHSFFNQPFNNNSRGTMTLNGTAWTGDAIGDLELGLIANSTITANTTRNYLRYDSYGSLVNDDFKAARNLTLNLGLRYEIDEPPHDKYDRLMNFVPALKNLVVANPASIPNFDALVAQAGLTGRVVDRSRYGLPRSLVYTNYKNLAPRFGYAWRPFNSTRTVIRGGYGIFFSGTLLNDVRLGLGTSFPFSTNLTFAHVTTNPSALILSSPWPQTLAALAGTNTATGFQLHAPTGYLQSYNFTVERDLGRGLVIVAAYVGSKGTHLGRQYNVNMPYRTVANYQAFGTSFPVPYPPLGTINYWDFGSNSIYNAGQLTLRKRAFRGSLVSLNYIRSKSIDNASQFTGASTGGFGQALDARNLALERARSDWDRENVFTAAFSWQVPFARNRRFLGGWQLSGTAQATSGQPFTVEDSSVNQNIGESTRPNRLANGAETSGAGRRGVDYPWFYPAAFAAVPGCASRTNCKPDAYGFTPFAPGNSGRNILEGPGLFYINTSLMKNFAAGERGRVQFRYEVFNIMNHPNFQLPNRFFNETAAGALDNALEAGRGGPRVMQFALKYIF